MGGLEWSYSKKKKKEQHPIKDVVKEQHPIKDVVLIYITSH
jgi:hypothetical protein